MGAERIYNRGEAVVGEKIKVNGKDTWVNAAIPSRPATDEWIERVVEERR